MCLTKITLVHSPLVNGVESSPFCDFLGWHLFTFPYSSRGIYGLLWTFQPAWRSKHRSDESWKFGTGERKVKRLQNPPPYIWRIVKGWNREEDSGLETSYLCHKGPDFYGMLLCTSTPTIYSFSTTILLVRSHFKWKYKRIDIPSTLDSSLLVLLVYKRSFKWDSS